MKMISAKEVGDQFGQLLDELQSNPVAISKDGKPYAVLLSISHMEALGGIAAVDAGLLRERIDRKLAASESMGGEIPHAALMTELKSRYAD